MKKPHIAQALLKAKVTRSLQVVDWLGQRYDIQWEIRVAKREAANLEQFSTVSQLRTVEGAGCVTILGSFQEDVP